MLRRHLKSGGAPVAACAGFDFDAASAYLEDALGQSHRAGYESHLAGCVTCRRHLIELARLSQTAPHVGTQPSMVADQTPAWIRLRGGVAGWFDASSWTWKWQMTGVAGAAFAILIAALGVQSLRQAIYQNETVISVNTSAPASIAAPVPSPASEPSPQDQSLIAEAESDAKQGARSRVPVPTPPVALNGSTVPGFGLAPSQISAPLPRLEPSLSDLAVPRSPSNETSKLNQNAQIPLNGRNYLTMAELEYFRRDATDNAQQSSESLQTDSRKIDNLPTSISFPGRGFQPFAPTPSANSEGNAGKSSRSDSGGGAPANPGAADSAGQSRIIPPRIIAANTGPVDLRPRPQTMAAAGEQNPPAEPNAQKPGPEPAGKAPTEKSSSRVAKVATYIAEALNPLPTIKPDINKESKAFADEIKPKSKSESLDKVKPKPADDESPKQLKQRIRDKLFIYQRDINMWFDQAYKEETMKFRVYPLRRGSKEYEDVLAKEPELREFFEHGPILVVWKNKIYKVK